MTDPGQHPEPPAAEGDAPVDPEATTVMPAPAKRQLFRRRDRSAEATADPEATAVIAAAAPTDTDDEAPADAATQERPARLERERRELIDRREDAVYHLGGLAYELHRRGLLLGRAMRSRAGAVTEIDDRLRGIDETLAEIERRREERREERKRAAAEKSASAAAVATAPAVTDATCPACSALAVAGAQFCWSCGAKLPVEEPAVATPGEDPEGGTT